MLAFCWLLPLLTGTMTASSQAGCSTLATYRHSPLYAADHSGSASGTACHKQPLSQGPLGTLLTQNLPGVKRWTTLSSDRMTAGVWEVGIPAPCQSLGLVAGSGHQTVQRRSPSPPARLSAVCSPARSLPAVSQSAPTEHTNLHSTNHETQWITQQRLTSGPVDITLEAAAITMHRS